jgi:hypothetical protein
MMACCSQPLATNNKPSTANAQDHRTAWEDLDLRRRYSNKSSMYKHIAWLHVIASMLA